jgi:hypothetical protein
MASVKTTAIATPKISLATPFSRLLVTLCIIFVPPPVQMAAAACLALPSTEYRALDEEVLRDPEHAVAEAEMRMARDMPRLDPVEVASLYAVIAEAREKSSTTRAAMAARRR